jgi:hypothetical protein
LGILMSFGAPIHSQSRVDVGEYGDLEMSGGKARKFAAERCGARKLNPPAAVAVAMGCMGVWIACQAARSVLTEK